MDYLGSGLYADTKSSSCTATLQNKDLWQQFHDLETEMIITKSGRRMFPALRTQIYQLDPLAHYCVLLEMVPVGNCRYRYSASAGWAPAGAEEAQSPHRVYLHPESPATGEHWMSQPISFGRVKLTNTASPPPGHLVLSSMHKFQPRIIIVKAADPRAISWAPSTTIVFQETQFIAVTAYQNEKITKLKIDNNPFAKGFRENGQSKCKRKRTPIEDADDKKPKREVKTPPSEASPPSSPRIDVCEDCTSSTSSSPELRQTEPQLSYSYPAHQYRSPYHNYDMYAYCLSQYGFYPYNPRGSYYLRNLLPKPLREDSKQKGETPNNLTDFSISAIMGFPENL